MKYTCKGNKLLFMYIYIYNFVNLWNIHVNEKMFYLYTVKENIFYEYTRFVVYTIFSVYD